MNFNKGFASMFIVLAAFLVIAVGSGAYLYNRYESAHSPCALHSCDHIYPQPETTTPQTTNNTSVQKAVSSSATIDQSSLTSSSGNPKISGTVSGASNICVSVVGQGVNFSACSASAGVSIVGNQWTTIVSEPSGNPVLKSGSYAVSVYDQSNPSAGVTKLLASGTLTVNGLPQVSFTPASGATFTLKVGQSASDGAGGITVKPLSVTGGQYPSTSVLVVSASTTVEASLAQVAQTWGLTPDVYVPGSGVGSELIKSAKWSYSAWPDPNSVTGTVRLQVIAIDPVAQTVIFKVITDPVPPERG